MTTSLIILYLLLFAVTPASAYRGLLMYDEVEWSEGGKLDL